MESTMKQFSFNPDKKFFYQAGKKLKQELRQDEDLRKAWTLPKNWDFNKADVHLTRQQKKALQVELSRMNKDQIKTQIKELKNMRDEKLKEAKSIKKVESIILPPNSAEEKAFQEAYKWAFYCREAAKFADYYLRSLEYQKKI